MALAITRNRSILVAFLGVATALVAVFDIMPSIGILPYAGIWDSWVFLISPIVGVILGPFIGAYSVGLGTLLGHFIYFRDPYEFIFMLGAPLGAAMAAFVYQRRWRPVLGIYSFLLVGYFLSPVSWALPLVGIWDCLMGFAVVLLFTLCTNLGWSPTSEKRSQLLLLLFTALIGLEADILLRIFILIPGQTYWVFYGLTIDALQYMWLTAGVITATKVTLGAIMTITVGLSLLQLLPHIGVPLNKEHES